MSTEPRKVKTLVDLAALADQHGRVRSYFVSQALSLDETFHSVELGVSTPDGEVRYVVGGGTCDDQFDAGLEADRLEVALGDPLVRLELMGRARKAESPASR